MYERGLFLFAGRKLLNCSLALTLNSATVSMKSFKEQYTFTYSQNNQSSCYFEEKTKFSVNANAKWQGL